MRKVIKGSWVIAAAIAGVVSMSASGRSTLGDMFADDGGSNKKPPVALLDDGGSNKKPPVALLDDGGSNKKPPVALLDDGGSNKKPPVDSVNA